MASAAEIAGALHGRKSGSGWIARCPAHDDRNPSLSISERGGRVLVHCHAGCSQNAVIEALKERGLWPEREWAPQDRARLVEEKRRREEAHGFARAGILLCDAALEGLASNDPQRASLTQLRLALERAPQTEVAWFKQNRPELFAALVAAWKRREKRMRARAWQFVRKAAEVGSDG